MKKILLLHHVSSQGGGTKSLVDMAAMMAPKYNVVVCIPQGSSGTIKLLKEHAINYYEVKTPIPSLNVYSGFPGYMNRYFLSCAFRFRRNKELVNELLRLEPDAIFYNTSVTSLIAKDVPPGIMNVCIVRETFIKSPFTGIIKKNFEDKFQGVAYIAEHEKKFLNLHNPKQIVIPDCPELKTVTIYNKQTMRKKYNIQDNCFCSLFMGGLIRIKGLDVLLKAADELGDNFKFIVAGAVEKTIFSKKYILRHCLHISYMRFIISVKKRLKKMEADGKVYLTGFITDISPFMSICDTVIFPSTAPHQPRPCIEAGNYERSCVISDYEATYEYFINGYNALTFRPGDAHDLADKIKYLAANPDVNAKLALNNKKMSQEKHNFPATQKVLYDFFEQILEN